MIREANRFKEILADNLIIDDWEAVDILLAVVAAFKVPHTEMLWLKLIGSSGSGKTEILRAISGLRFSEVVEHVTPAALRGGYRPRRSRFEPMLLERIDGKLVVTKDFAILLTARKDIRTEVFGLMRGIYDGFLDSDFDSSEGHLHQKSRFDWVVGTTYYYETERQLETALGSRFIDLRWQGTNNRERAGDKAVENDPVLERIRPELVKLLQEMVDNIKPEKTPPMPYRAKLADFTARMRTPIRRDSVTREVMEVPDAEMPTRLSQVFARIGAGLYSIGIQNIQPYILRVALDTIPKTRAAIIRSLLSGLRGREEIAAYCKVSRRALDYVREEMEMLGFKEDDDLSFLRPQVVEQACFMLTEKGRKEIRDGRIRAIMKYVDQEYEKAEMSGDTAKMRELESYFKEMSEDKANPKKLGSLCDSCQWLYWVDDIPLCDQAAGHSEKKKRCKFYAKKEG